MRVVDIAKKGMDVDATDGLSRRAVLMTATIAAGAASGAPTVLAADSPSAASFGAPLVFSGGRAVA
jgi:hypothetical protein